MSGRGRYFNDLKPDKSYKICKEHEFCLNPLSKTHPLFFHEKLSVNFCLHHDSTTFPHVPNNPSFLKQFSTMPFMPMFGNSQEIGYYKKHANQYKKQFDRQADKVQRYQSTAEEKVEKQGSTAKFQQRIPRMLRIKQQEIFQPIPNKCYCQVCRLQFQDYLEHVESKLHKECVKRSMGKQLIESEMYKIKMQNDSIEETTDYKQIMKTWKVSKNYRRFRKAIMLRMVD